MWCGTRCLTVHCFRSRWNGSCVSCRREFYGAPLSTNFHGLRSPSTATIPVLKVVRREFHHPTRPLVGASQWLRCRPKRGHGQEAVAPQPKDVRQPQKDETSKTSGPTRSSIITREDSSQVSIYRVMKHVLHHLWPVGKPRYRAMVVASVSCVVLAKVLKVAVPFWFKTIIDTLTNSGEVAACATTIVEAMQIGVFGLVVAYGISRLVSSFTEEMKSALFAPVGCHASTTIAMELFAKLHSLDLQYHLGRETGVLSKDLDRGSRAFWSLAHALLFMVVPTAFEVALVCTVMKGCAGTPFILTAFSAVVMYICWTYVVSNWRAEYRARFNKGDSRVGGLTIDSLLNYETVKYFGREAYEESRLRRETSDMNHQLMRLDQSMSLLNFGQQAIFVLAAVVTLYLSTCGVLAGSMTVGDLVLVDALLMQLYTPLSFLGMIYRDVQASTQNMQAMIALLDVENSVKECADARTLELTSGAIELRDVCFSFKGDGSDRLVLRNVSLTIPGGSTVAFVGPSGSGKSTIFRLIYRFYDPDSGFILIDGQPLTQLQIASFRSAIGVIPQDTVLFNETLRYNICYGRPDATEEDMIEAARVAGIHASIMNMSDKYDTVVGERGLKLSGGEKQRIAIARVVLRDPAILLADEATAALDSATEAHVMQRLCDSGGKRRTLVLIAHRLTSIMGADKIFVLDGRGSLAESGTHEELLQKGGLYSELWCRQLHDARHAGE